ncbi:AAA family ATPase [Streptomyces lydicus]|uniref:AAA family ATPase n=1 Tax=Streptomyces lydicus TaxID=47763 RepID=UPI0037A3562F
MGSQAPTTPLVGRTMHLALLRGLVKEAAAGKGAAIWVEGEPGVGKTALVTTALTDAGKLGCRTGWAAADEFSVRLPLRGILTCLDVDTAHDARHAASLQCLYGRPILGELTGPDPVLSAMENVLALVDGLCTQQPMILAIDDMQWADEASLISWHRLTHVVEQLPLLLIAISRPSPERAAVAQLRRSVQVRGSIVRLLPLATKEVAALVEQLVGCAPGPRLLRTAARAAGNPLYVRELVGALSAEGQITISAGQAELVDGTADSTLPSLGALIQHRLAFLAPQALEMLGTAALLGPEFTVTDLAAVLQSPASQLLTGLRQALAAGVITETESGFVFEQPLIRQVLHDSLPSALRPVLHRQIARVLAESGASSERVAEQLLAMPSPTDRATLGWIAQHAAQLAHQVPDMAAELLERVVDEGAGTASREHDMIVSGLAKAYFRLGRLDAAEKHAWQVLGRVSQVEPAAEMRWTLTRVLFSSGRSEQARIVIDQALQDVRLPPRWQARFQALSAMSLRSDGGDLDEADRRALQALELAESADEPFATGYALCVRWLVNSARRDHEAALAAMDRALSVLDDRPEHQDLRSCALENRLFTLHNLDRLSDADAACRAAVDNAQRGDGARVSLHIGSAVHDFWRGRWDDAVASLDSIGADSPEITHFGLRERGASLLHHGLSALVASHRDERDTARRHLEAGLRQPVSTVFDWENFDFLLAAQALEAERGGCPEKAVGLLSMLLDVRPGQMTLIHQWLPDLVRLAIEVGDRATASAAVEACAAEAAREQKPARAAAAVQRCRGLLEADPAPLIDAAQHYARVGRVFEQAQALEDAAVLLARHRPPDARSALAEATSLYEGLGAVWDVRRADTRIRPHGIRRGARGPRARASFGWEALTPTELRVARLVAEGKSNPEVAADLFLSRRTVQTHVSHILLKLGVHSRVEIATEALRHPEEAPPTPE